MSSRGGKRQSGGILFRLLGFVLTLLLVFIAVAIPMWMIAGHKPSKDEIPAVVTKQIAEMDEHEHKIQETPRYDFYQELAQRKNEVDAEIKRKTLEMQERIKPIKGSSYRVQVGAFQNEDEANRMKARMILRDYPVSIIQSENFYLVQVGPYKERDEALAIEKKLRREGVDTMLKRFVQ